MRGYTGGMGAYLVVNVRKFRRKSHRNHMATSIPRGIQTLIRKQDGKKIVKYRVQAKRKGMLYDKLFDEADDAVTFLSETKTADGRLRIAKGEDALSVRDSLIQKHMDEVMSGQSITLGQAIDLYLKTYVNPGLDSGIDKVIRTAKVNKSRLLHCKTIKVGYFPKGSVVPSGPYAKLKTSSKAYRLTPIGEIPLDEMTAEHSTGYIRARQSVVDGKKTANSTVKREIGAMQSCINKLEHTDSKSWMALKGSNPFARADKTLLRGGTKRRRRVITEDEEEIFLKHLNQCRNKEMVIIFALSLQTALRRAELLSLRWDQIDMERGYIDLDPSQAKTGEERLIPLSKEAIDALNALPRKDAKLFHLKIEGYKTNFYRLVKNTGIENFTHHDLRRSCISRIYRDITASPVAIAERIGVSSVRSLEESTLRPLRRGAIAESGRPTTQDAAMQMAGHENIETHLGYTNVSGLKGK